ncbi:uncharacterized protein LOC134711744 isoform X1 [Mytilus trossulus]|uniref:uncharacterized protein LOC134711744 isoform X1 n=1 Tax=Mytilus trossulus TaxID=6551 RepID=UPI0030071AF8
MKFTLLILIIALLCGIGHAYPDRRGICLTFCGTFSKHTCPQGYECRSNGCGHECYRPMNFQAPANCIAPSCEGQSHCPVGYKVDSNGCDTCDCDWSAMKDYSQLG